MSEYAFTRQQRLLSGKDYKRVFDKAKRLSTPVLTIVYRKNSLAHARLGLAVAKKQLPRAVQRNRIKRLARETFRLNCAQMGSYDLILMVRRGVLQMDNQQISEMLSKQLIKLS